MSDARSTTPLERLQALSAAATPGPWKADPKRLVIDHGNGLKSGGPVMSYLAGDRSSGEGMKVSLGSERIADHQFVAELVNAFRAGLLTPPSETKAISRDDLETALNIALAALGHFNTEQTDKHWNEQERELRQIEKRMRLSTPSAGVALTPAEVIERCAAIVDEMQEAWHDSTEENSGHYMDAAQRIADVLRERAKHAPFLAGTPVSATLASDGVRLLWLETLLKHCPHADLTWNDDEDEGPLGWRLLVESCSKLDLRAPTLEALIDLGMKAEPDEDGDVIASVGPTATEGSK